MLIFGHAGITLGAATLLDGAITGRRAGRESWFISLAKRVDVRLLLLGSLLPDIIDKPLGQWLFRGTFSYGRLFSHSLLFLVILAAAGYLLYRRRHRIWLLTIAFGVLMHLVLDEMWLAPVILLWPFLGNTFPRIDVDTWMSGIFHALLTDPHIYVPELVGAVVLAWFGLALVRRHQVGNFIKHGRVK